MTVMTRPGEESRASKKSTVIWPTAFSRGYMNTVSNLDTDFTIEDLEDIKVRLLFLYFTGVGICARLSQQTRGRHVNGQLLIAEPRGRPQPSELS